jgi:LPPG:FO 2-phospho-L-lactate transferase
MRRLISGARVPVIAVSPIIAGAAVKGPAAKMMSELRLEPSAATVAAHYRGLVTGFVMDNVDAAIVSAVESQGMTVKLTEILMKSDEDRRRLADECIAFALSLHR